MVPLAVKVKIGSLLNQIPYSLVPGIGGVYNHCLRARKEYETADRKEWIFHRVYRVVEHAVNNIPFYKELYARKGFSLDQLRSFSDIEKIPIISKKDLMEVPLEDRSTNGRLRYVANTGGSTGIPLSFYKTRRLQVKEMAYYHQAWAKLGYDPSKLRLQFGGNAVSDVVSYDLTRNRLVASIYAPKESVLEQISALTKQNHIPFLQGYPSVLYEFSLYLEKHPELLTSSGLRNHLKGILLNSEYPFPEYRERIEDILGVPTIASYGHTEGCIVAFDYGSQSYEVEQSYGYAEAVEQDGELHLIGTTYDNLVSPFIRYDTGDTVDSIYIEDGIMKSFMMTDGGRSGQFILDKEQNRVSLTGLIFGRHHQLFNYCSQMQISQSEPGKAVVYYVAEEGALQDRAVEDLFDTSGVNIVFAFKRVDRPYRTAAGKALLLIPPHTIEDGE